MTPGANTRAALHSRQPLRLRWSRRLVLLAAATVLAFLSMIAPASAQAEGDPSKVGDLTGNLPLAVYLLIPLALALALLTAILLGPRGDPAGTLRRTGGVTRALTDRTDPAQHPPP